MIHWVQIIFFIIFGILWAESDQDVMSNTTNNTLNKDLLSEISYGDECIPNKLYRMECNTCRCGKQNSLFCTKMACLEEGHIKKLKEQAKNRDDKYLRKGQPKKREFPELADGPCEPGRIYSNSEYPCSYCLCDASRKISGCSQRSCKSTSGNRNAKYRIRSLLDVRPAFHKEELQNMAKLPHRAAKCTPGDPYEVDCNVCVCLHNGNLLCTKNLCLSYDEFNKNQARKQNGLSCEDCSGRNECIKCKCEKNKLQCEPILGCVPQTVLKSRSARLSIDAKSRNCIPGMVYRDDCNNCYCQEDRNLRCTNKACLNYAQHVAVMKHRQYLEKYGL